MKAILTTILFLLTTARAFAQNESTANSKSLNTVSETTVPVSEILLPMLFMAFLAFMLVSLIKYFLEYRLRNKLLERGMHEQLSVYLSNKDEQEKRNEAVKRAILFCGLGLGLIITYLTTPVHIHSLAIMAFSLGVSYLAYFFYLRRQK
jgi:hypothetical protein